MVCALVPLGPLVVLTVNKNTTPLSSSDGDLKRETLVARLECHGTLHAPIAPRGIAVPNAPACMYPYTAYTHEISGENGYMLFPDFRLHG